MTTGSRGAEGGQKGVRGGSGGGPVRSRHGCQITVQTPLHLSTPTPRVNYLFLFFTQAGHIPRSARDPPPPVGLLRRYIARAFPDEGVVCHQYRGVDYHRSCSRCSNVNPRVMSVSGHTVTSLVTLSFHRSFMSFHTRVLCWLAVTRLVQISITARVLISSSFHCHFIVISLSFHCHFIGISLAFHWHFIGISLAFHWHFIGISFSLHCHSVVIPLAFHWHFSAISLSFHCHFIVISVI
jgi:hypothetical protein